MRAIAFLDAVHGELELTLDDVPNFAQWFNFDDKSDMTWYLNFLAFLKGHDLYAFDLDATGGIKEWIPQGYHFINGPSPRGEYDHVIVGLDGLAVHDPYPDGNCELLKHDTWTIFASRLGG